LKIFSLERAFILIVFSSGFCSLFYQIAWERLARYNFGGDHTSSTIIIAIFLLGLGIGALLFGKVKKNHLLIYGVLEIFIGVFALFSFGIIDNLAIDLLNLVDISFHNLRELYFFTIFGCLLFFLVPTILMGGTLPLMFGSLFSITKFDAKALGDIYAINILGAMAGSIAASYLLLNNLSIPNAINLIGVLNLIIGFVSLSIYYNNSTQSSIESSHHYVSREVNFPRLITFIFGAFTGIVEILFIRHAFNLIPSSAYNFTFVISAVLLSLSLGSTFFSSKKIIRDNLLKSICYLSFATILGLFLSNLIINSLYESQIAINEKTIFKTFFYFFFIIFPIFFPLGAIFPLLCLQGDVKPDSLAKQTGNLYLANSFGAFIGIMSFHFIGIVSIGTIYSLIILISLLIAILFLASFTKSKLLFTNVILTLGCISLFQISDFKNFIFGNLPINKLAIVKEGSSGIAMMAWNNGEGSILINGQPMGKVPVDKKHALQISAALHPNKSPQNILVLGIGSGSYIRYFLDDLNIKKIVAVDWSSEINHVLLDSETTARIGNTIYDSRLEVINGDARIAIEILKGEKFDLIIDNLVYPTWVGSTGVRTPNYFIKLADLLSEDGYFAMTTNYSRFRDRIISSLFKGFIYIYENLEGNIILASKKNISLQILDNDDFGKRFHKDSQMNIKELSKILNFGFQELSPRCFNQIRPLDEKELFTEFYLLNISRDSQTNPISCNE